MVAVHTLAASNEPVERRLAVGGTEVRLVEAGEGDPVLLLHGFGDSINTWRVVLPQLARRHRVLCVDLPGFGESGPPASGRLIDCLADTVDAVLRRTCRGVPATIVGNSMGGSVALRIAMKRPARVSRLVLIGCAGLAPGVPLWWRLVLGQVIPFRAVAGRVTGVAPAVLIENVAARVYARLVFANPGGADAATLRGFARFYRRASDLDRLLRLGELLVSDLIDGRIAAEAPHVPHPTLLLWGRQDRLVPVAHAEALRTAAPHMRLQVIDRCGHCPQVERPAQFVSAVEAFLRKRSASPDASGPGPGAGTEPVSAA